MAFADQFRLSSHAVIANDADEILLLKANYGDRNWGLPGGALEPGETIHEALLRECHEELGCVVEVKYLSGVYYHQVYQSHAFIFRCVLPHKASIQLSEEHTEYQYQPLETLSSVQQQRVRDCLQFNGVVSSAKF